MDDGWGLICKKGYLLLPAASASFAIIALLHGGGMARMVGLADRGKGKGKGKGIELSAW